MLSITENANLFAHNTFGMEVSAALFAEYDTVDELQQILSNPAVIALMEQNRSKGELPFWHIGSGSNLLFRGNYEGVVLHCTAKGIEIMDETSDDCLLKVKAGTIWDDVCAYCADHDLYGAENLSLIPGETGAAAVQNIGAYGVEMKDIVVDVICWDVNRNCTLHLSNQQMQYGYRQSLLKLAAYKSQYIVTEVVIKLSKREQLHLGYAGLKQAVASDQPSLQEVRHAVISIREGKLPDPKVLGNAGSFFKNPVVDNSIFEQLLAEYPQMPHYIVDESHTKIPAGWLIEQCGWKGKSLGKAGVYHKQSLVLVNLGGATPQDVIDLCDAVRRDVSSKFGIDIEPEVNIIS